MRESRGCPKVGVEGDTVWVFFNFWIFNQPHVLHPLKNEREWEGSQTLTFIAKSCNKTASTLATVEISC